MPAITLERRAVVRQIVGDRDDALIAVAGLGSPCWDLAAAGDHPLNFYLNGAMGSAAAIGLGLALAQPNYRIVVLTGDGELLMALGILATIAVAAPKNLALVVLDNERYLETGGQPTHTGRGVDLAAVAAACKFREARTVYRQEELDAELPRIRSAAGPLICVVKITAERPPLVLPPLEATYTKHRMREHLIGRP
ncbi:MAG: aldehyde dehydrogenase [Candidatus Eremiobacteraeota bacterium]|nr:aldehyde dehydrogenase [Candidatus Eremiobacteraeota bacterium]